MHPLVRTLDRLPLFGRLLGDAVVAAHSLVDAVRLAELHDPAGSWSPAAPARVPVRAPERQPERRAA
ncbi:MAG: hypothetical protein V2J02_04065 [Pseudomonadales bacterium]|jgi:hypothetical protein|nr:hypothetical protein [Pseudomonadales bacterium]